MNANKSGTNNSAKLELESGRRRCSAEHCPMESIIVLGERALCLQHFITRCYEWLDQLDAAARDRMSNEADASRLRALTHECSNRALLVSLRCETLDNLDRSRLLDILLRAGELLFRLRLVANASAWLPAFSPEAANPAAEKRVSLGSQLHTNKIYGL